MAIYFFINVIQ